MGLTSKLKLSKSNEKLSSTNENTDDIDEVDNAGQSILMNIISQLRPGCDLTKITLPTFILERKSMLERITNQLQTPDILLQANATSDPLERFVLVVKWYLSCWHIAPKAVKKPLNPILGEIFTCYWDDLPNGNKAYYVAEQTSHHPPKSSYFYVIPESKIRVDGIVIPKSRFLGNSTAAMMEGLTYLTFETLDETYSLSQPNMYARGILFGKLKFELGDHMIIKCEKTGFEADIEFKTKGFIGGTYDAIDGVIKNSSNEVLYTLSGKWNEIIYIKNNKGEKKELFNVSDSKNYIPKTRPLDEQLDIESRKLWDPVTEALAKRNHEVATDEKFKIENEQRDIAKQRLENGVEFKPKLFKNVNDSRLPGLEFALVKDLDESSPEALTKDLFDLAAFLPGQTFNPAVGKLI